MQSEPVVVSVPDREMADDLADLAADGRVELVVWDLGGPHSRAAGVHLAVVPYMTRLRLADVVPSMTSLVALQLQSAGFEQYVDDVPASVLLCNAAGVHDASTAELALALTLASVRDLPAFHDAQAAGRWEPLRLRRALADRRVLVLGYGHVGRAVVRRFLPFEVAVTAVASRARAGDDLVERVHGLDELPALLPHHDVLVVVVPLSDATRGLVGADVLAGLPDGALVVNVARGPVVDTDALVAECASGRLTAALDVTDPEPLPQDHPLWTTPGVLVTPHVGGATDAMRPRMLRLARAQVEALRDGRPLANVVPR